MQTPAAKSVHALQHQFLAILPGVETHARAAFRHLRCPHDRDDAAAAAVARAWELFRAAPAALAEELAAAAVSHVRAELRRGTPAAC